MLISNNFKYRQQLLLNSLDLDFFSLSEENERLRNPLYAIHVVEEVKREEAQQIWEEKERDRKHHLWLLDEQRALQAISLKNEKEEKEIQRLREQEVWFHSENVTVPKLFVIK